MDAKIRVVWLVVECPHCNSPQTVRKQVLDNKVLNIIKPRYHICELCGEGYFLVMEVWEEKSLSSV